MIFLMDFVHQYNKDRSMKFSQVWILRRIGLFETYDFVILKEYHWHSQVWDFDHPQVWDFDHQYNKE